MNGSTYEEVAAHPTVPAFPLRALKKGQSAVISAITAEGEMGRRIRDMGLIPGVQVKCVGHAPLNDPMAMRLMGFTLTLRNKEADYIQVRA
ncbi:MAG: ferrous iron transport protein A [Deltaproteobacteria bacterium]|nr:ferrous iron transport protein A [Deltaproteobacteria bacterium]